MEREINSAEEMMQFGRLLGALCHGGEVIELIGDIGAGKTTLTKGIAAGLGVVDEVLSPTFTLSRTYETHGGGILVHYDFYRLADPGILSAELADASRQDTTTIVIEWADTVHQVLPEDRLRLTIAATADEVRRVTLTAGGPKSRKLIEELK